MACVRCGTMLSYKLTKGAKDILGYSSDVYLCKQCVKVASDYVSCKGKTLIIRNNRVGLHKNKKDT